MRSRSLGELDVCVNNIDIVYIERRPVYYDGRQEILTLDKSKVIKAKINGLGEKVNIITLNIEDVLMSNLEMQIVVNTGNDEEDERVEKNIESWRK